MRVTLTDSRVLIGQFLAFDKVSPVGTNVCGVLISSCAFCFS